MAQVRASLKNTTKGRHLHEEIGCKLKCGLLVKKKKRAPKRKAKQFSKQLSFYGAAAVSLLYNKQEEGTNTAETLHKSPTFQVIRDLGIVSSMWPLARVIQRDEIKSTPPVLAWSNRLQTILYRPL